MNPDKDLYQRARSIAINLIGIGETPTEAHIADAVDSAIMVLKAQSFDKASLLADLLHSFSIRAGGATSLDDPKDHEEWLPNKRGAINWNFWNRYREYLLQSKEMPPPVVSTLDTLTDDVLRRLENPERPGPWDRRGMVVGSVQSGKTSHYTGLICKAADAGYRVIIILAGMHDSLRSQTQLRIDEGFLGYDTRKMRHLDPDQPRFGVSSLPGEILHVMSLTSSPEDGDFKRNVADAITSTLGGIPTLIVVKKNGPILKNLITWMRRVGLHGSRGHGKCIQDIPLLLIDDEADNASVNTSKDDIATINRRVRELLQLFDKSAYVGYTATPFANIFIRSFEQTHQNILDRDSVGEDIFPRSFILNLRPPSNYVGPARVFGLEADPDIGIEGREPLPLVIPINDYEEQFPHSHKNGHVPASLPPSLRRALGSFLIACAIRIARGQVKTHNSMLVHVTRFVSVQQCVHALVTSYLQNLRVELRESAGSRGSAVHQDLEAIWADVFDSKYDKIAELAGDEVGRRLAWGEIQPHLLAAISKIDAKLINGTAKDVLDYTDVKDGLSVIAIGGDKLSRGLTLEGLSVSYFLRASRMYDTLMQMGRWFGYRPGYLDLCRLFTTQDLISWYGHIALAEEELRREFDYMAGSGLTPENYGLRVRAHPGRLAITAANKMRSAENIQLSFAGRIVQIAAFWRDIRKREWNFEEVGRFLGNLPAPRTTPAGRFTWENVPAQNVIDLLGKLDVPPPNFKADPKCLKEFIKTQAVRGELTDWTVALISTQNSGKSFTTEIAGLSVGCVIRSGDIHNDIFITLNSNIQSPSDQSLDLEMWPELDATMLSNLMAKRSAGSPIFSGSALDIVNHSLGTPLKDLALRLTLDRNPDAKIINGKIARDLRPVTHGLLLIYPIVEKDAHPASGEPPHFGFAFCFPTSPTARAIQYAATQLLVQKMMGDWDDDDSV